jgi:hypothetical protein
MRTKAFVASCVLLAAQSALDECTDHVLGALRGEPQAIAPGSGIEQIVNAAILFVASQGITSDELARLAAAGWQISGATIVEPSAIAPTERRATSRRFTEVL